MGIWLLGSNGVGNNHDLLGSIPRIPLNSYEFVDNITPPHYDWQSSAELSVINCINPAKAMGLLYAHDESKTLIGYLS